MNALALYATMVSILSTCALAQSVQNFTPCKFSQSASLGVTNGIEVRRVNITDNATDYAATVFLPSSHNPTPGVLFSHSAMKGANGSADLLRFAYALARAGSAAIVLDGTMSWDQPSNGNERSPHLLACAGQWLLTNAAIDRNRLAQAGYLGQWGGGATPFCMAGEDPCWPGGTWLNFGESLSRETSNTKLMLTREGQLQFANFARRHLGLAEIQPEWLEGAVQRP